MDFKLGSLRRLRHVRRLRLAQWVRVWRRSIIEHGNDGRATIAAGVTFDGELQRIETREEVVFPFLTLCRDPVLNRVLHGKDIFEVVRCDQFSIFR